MLKLFQECKISLTNITFSWPGIHSASKFFVCTIFVRRYVLLRNFFMVPLLLTTSYEKRVCTTYASLHPLIKPNVLHQKSHARVNNKFKNA